MSEESARCEQVGQWLLEPGSKEAPPEWNDHLETCGRCREQVWIHRSLVVAFTKEDVPELSLGFEAGLEKRLVAVRLEVRPLSGWRWAAMIAYGAAAIGILGWVLKDAPLPTIDPSAPWVLVAALIAVPLTFLLAIAASRRLPAPGPQRRIQAFAL